MNIRFEYSWANVNCAETRQTPHRRVLWYSKSEQSTYIRLHTVETVEEKKKCVYVYAEDEKSKANKFNFHLAVYIYWNNDVDNVVHAILIEPRNRTRAHTHSLCFS